MADDHEEAPKGAVRNDGVSPVASRFGEEKQVTGGPGGKILTNIAVWSPDSRLLVYDTRSDADGTLFDGNRIETVDVETGEIRTAYESRNGACCGVATFHPTRRRIVFILGPEHPTPDWTYGPSHRQGVIVDLEALPGVAINLDARDLTPPFTPGALRGGTHVHVYSPDGQYVSFTYNDAVLSKYTEPTGANDTDQRNIGVCFPASMEKLSRLSSIRSGEDGPASRSHPGTLYSVLVTRTSSEPPIGSDEIQRAFEEGWVGTAGYRRSDGGHQKRALAFLGEVLSKARHPLIEVFVVDLPEDLTVSGDDGPLEGTETRRPGRPRGTAQRRLTFTADRRYPGVQGPRHWVRSSPDGSHLAFLMRSDSGVVQIWTISPNGGDPVQITRDEWGVASAFSWSPEGKEIAYIADNSVFSVNVRSAQSRRLTGRSSDADAPLALACVYSPDGRRIAYLRRLPESPAPDAPRLNQIFVVSVP